MKMTTFGRFRHHQYRYTNSFGSPSHWWELVGPDGGVHFHVVITAGYEPSCGLEFHHAARANYHPGTAPDHTECPLIGEPCWHDGTSLYASETLWPMVKPMLSAGDHDAVFRLLESEYDKHFARYVETIEAAALAPEKER